MVFAERMLIVLTPSEATNAHALLDLQEFQICVKVCSYSDYHVMYISIHTYARTHARTHTHAHAKRTYTPHASKYTPCSFTFTCVPCLPASDIDECLQPNTCQQNCTNIAGSFACSCNDNFSLIPNDTSMCISELIIAEFLYACDVSFIRQCKGIDRPLYLHFKVETKTVHQPHTTIVVIA